MNSRSILPAGLVLDGSYEILRTIGSGGFGITYEALDHGLGKKVALKEYYPGEFGARDTTQSVRPRTEKDRDLFEKLKLSFIREARTLSHFDHRAIVRVLRVFEAHGTAYMVMNYEAGPTLKSWLAELGRKPTQAELDELVVPLLGALEIMHKSHFLHRDIAPDNIIVRDDGSPVLLDFGSTRRVKAELTRSITGVVKMGYSPMEQYAVDSKAQGAWTDVYAFGATLYRCVVGREPQESMLRMLDDQTIPASKIGLENYRASFLTAIDAAMAVRPEARPQTIDAFRRLLLNVDQSPKLAAIPEQQTNRVMAAPKLPTALPLAFKQLAEDAKNSLRRRRTMALALSAVCLAIVGAYALQSAFTSAKINSNAARKPEVQAPFSAHGASAGQNLEAEQKRAAAEAEALRRADEERRRQAEINAKLQDDARRAAAEADAKSNAEIERQRQAETEAKRKDDVKRAVTETETNRKAEEEKLRQAEIEAKQQADAKRAATEAEEKRKADEERKKAAAEERRKAVEIERARQAKVKLDEERRRADAEARKAKSTSPPPRQASESQSNQCGQWRTCIGLWNISDAARCGQRPQGC